MPILDIIPSTPHLVGAEIELVNFTEREYIQTEILEPIKPLYDFIFIDCPPSLGMVPVNSLIVSDHNKASAMRVFFWD
ncbi:MAG: AAA family ATPase [Cytophagaceae bacterium]|nr:AAA family ATPase [Cytophagaceae bacterium]